MSRQNEEKENCSSDQAGTPRSVEEYLQQEGLRRVPVPADGHCLLHAWHRAMQEEGINTYESYGDLLTALLREFTEHKSFYSPFMLDGWQIQLINYCVYGAFNSAIGDLVIYGLSNLTALPCKVVTEGCNKVPYIHVVTPDRLNKTDVHDGGLLLLLMSLHYEPLVKMEPQQSDEEKGEVFGCKRQELHQNDNSDGQEVHQNNDSDGQEVHRKNDSDGSEVHQNNDSDGQKVHQNNDSDSQEVHQNHDSDGQEVHQNHDSDGPEVHQNNDSDGQKVHQNNDSDDQEVHQTNNSDGQELHQTNNSDGQEVHQTNNSDGQEVHQKNQNIMQEDPEKVLEVKLTECDEKLNEDVGDSVNSEPVAEIKMRKSIMMTRRLWSTLKSKFRRNTNKTEKIRNEIKPSWIRRCLASMPCCFGSKTKPE